MAITYPVYLDVPMMVSVLAAHSDGLKMTEPLASLGVDLEGRIGGPSEDTTERLLSQRHTIASLFNQLQKQMGQETITVDSAQDLESVTDGSFVTLAGPLIRNPIYEFVIVMERLFAIAESQSKYAEGEDAMDIPEETRQVFNALSRELNESPVVDATVKTNQGITGIISLKKAYLRHVSLDDLRFGRINVLAKAVGTLPESQGYSLLNRSLVGHMVSSAFDDALEGLQAVNPDGSYPIATEVIGPGVFLVPMAIYI